MRIETERLMIRSLELDDADVLAAIWSDADVTAYLGGRRQFTEVRRGLEEDVRVAGTYNPPLRKGDFSNEG